MNKWTCELWSSVVDLEDGDSIVTRLGDDRRNLDWWLDLLDTSTPRDYTLYITHRLVSSVALLWKGFQWRMPHCFVAHVLTDDDHPTPTSYSDRWLQLVLPSSGGSWAELTHRKIKVKVKLLLRPKVSRPVCLGIKHPCGAQYQIFISVRQLQPCWCGVLSLTRGQVCRLPEAQAAVISLLSVGTIYILHVIKCIYNTYKASVSQAQYSGLCNSH
jgi:hypothetical protein